jgi:phage shock protein A
MSVGIFSRIRDVFRGRVNDIIDRAENPTVMLNQYLRDLGRDIQKAHDALALQMAVENQLLKEYRDAEALAKQRDEQAIQALKLGDEGLAERCLLDKHHLLQKAEAFKQQYETARANTLAFRQQYDQLRADYEKAKNDHRILVSRHESAKALEQLHRTMGKINISSVMNNFERMARRVSTMEARVQASMELYRSERQLQTDLNKLTGRQAVDAEIAALRQRLGLPTAATQ